jgi:apolipoprotein N-acyltransferase
MMQLFSVTGLWGFVFLSMLPASLINHIWEHRFNGRVAAIAIASFAVILMGVHGYGTFRLASSEKPETVRIASIVLLPADGNPVSMEPFFSSKKVLPYEATMSRIEDLTAKAVAGGAQIVSFQEHLLTVMELDIQKVRADYQRIARENAVWLSITYSWYAESDDSKGNNLHLLIDDQGQIQADYEKRYLWGFGAAGETLVFNKGAEIIQTVATPHGRIAISVCRDMSFPAFARQAGRAGADIMLSPSYDFPKSNDPSDSKRSIENGFTLIRPTYNGVTYAIDPYGRILALADSADSGSGILFADVPKRGVPTFYARWGDWFGWLNVLLLVLLAGAALIGGRFRQSSAAAGSHAPGS